MSTEHEDKLEQRIRFISRHYKEEALDADKAWKRFAAGHEVARTTPFRRYWLRVAAAILVLIAGGTFFVMERNRTEWVAIVTGPGQLKEVYLPDSTCISLAGNSRIRYDIKEYGKERRVVEMKGKAFFQVKRNEARPFSVKTKQTKITVLGTSFQVDEEGCTTEVHVVTGKVSFTADEEKKNLILTAGMSAAYTMEQKEITLLTEEDTNYLSWKTGQLRFNNTPLDKVISDLANYYQVKITNRSESTNTKLTATFNQLPIDEVLMVINQTLDVRLVPETGK